MNIHKDNPMFQDYDLIRKIAQKLNPKFQIIEFVLVLLIIIITALKFLSSLYVNPILVMSIGLLSTLYFIMGFAIDDYLKENGMLVYLGKLSSWGLSFLVLGFLFTLNHFPNSTMMLNIGTLASILSLIFALYIKKEDEKISKFLQSIFIRNLLYGSIGVVLILQQHQIISF
jgi:hypothetical protein